MSSTGRAWLVAASIGAVEAMKDQGFCRWNYALRLLQQRAKTDLRSFSQTKKLSPAAAAKRQQQKSKQSEESLRKVMYLSFWGPN
ncbi:Wound-responsive family protein [Perilla frutescens var. hirtella]|uniref:Wound-responsive family protein n=1 Tax=Perilla frutescens var. hirtella TaxID=608512 RepID=A0AAD4PDX5_PERFH|nr:Wound-responsive family protein [Perilla frutescens var. frutescens]KAH6775694.1 Wound-responsive family protein [Perilla frutescens var. hirtella]KAH6835585.1 Wound-responsive family protein [Perilla frutescens var. hirtella]